MSFFFFEKSYENTLEFIPMKVRYLLDKTKIKLSLDQWQLFNFDERNELCSLYNHLDEITFLNKIKELWEKHKIKNPIPIMENDTSSFFLNQYKDLEEKTKNVLNTHKIDKEQWLRFNFLDQYALIKLTTKKKLSKDIIPLIEELKNKYANG